MAITKLDSREDRDARIDSRPMLLSIPKAAATCPWGKDLTIFQGLEAAESSPRSRRRMVSIRSGGRWERLPKV